MAWKLILGNNTNIKRIEKQSNVISDMAHFESIFTFSFLNWNINLIVSVFVTDVKLNTVTITGISRPRGV